MLIMENNTTIPKLTVILDDVRSIYNVGSAFRTADAVGVGEIVLAGFTPGPDTHPERIQKTALGAQQSVPWRRVKRVGDAIRRLRSAGAMIVALETGEASVDYRAFKPLWPLVVVVGNEVKGVSTRLLRSRRRITTGLRRDASQSGTTLCNVGYTSHNVVDLIVQIPMRGDKESLNVSVALGVALYEFTRRWKK